MHRKLVLFVGATALVAGSVFATTAAVRAQQESPDMEAMMQKMMELATPGPEHAELQKHAGTWEQTYRMKWSPESPWMESKGTAEMTPILGGRFVMEKVQFEIPGMGQAEGMQLMGFDKSSGEYISLWADSMSTWWVESRGKKQADGTIDLRGIMKDVAGERPYRMVIKNQSETESDADMYDTILGEEVLVMQIHSKKK